MRMAKAILSTYNLVIKFPIDVGIGEVRGNQLMAKEFYFGVVKRR